MSASGSTGRAERANREPQRAAVFVRHPDGREERLVGTAQIDGAWLHVWPDSPDAAVVSFPGVHITAVEWEGDREW